MPKYCAFKEKWNGDAASGHQKNPTASWPHPLDTRISSIFRPLQFEISMTQSFPLFSTVRTSDELY
jgi:hypothetical protein